MRFRFKKTKVQNLLKEMDKQIFLIAAVTALLFLFYIDPLANVDMADWDRTFSPAVLSGISIGKRIQNFYFLFFLFIPMFFSFSALAYTLLFNVRPQYKKIYLKISMILLCSVVVSYVSRYMAGFEGHCAEVLIKNMLAFQGILTVIALIDAKQIFCFSDVTCFFVGYMVAVLSSNILLRVSMNVSILIVWVCLMCYAAVACKTAFGARIFKDSQNLLFLLMWTPAILRLTLEGIYLLTERGKDIRNYYTCIGGVALVFVFLSVAIVFLFRKKKLSFSTVGFVGAILSLCALSFFAYTYQYMWPLSRYSGIYEGGNTSVFADTVFYGKIPIVDYFSAHALGDMWTHLIYYLLHSDIKTVLANPYFPLGAVGGVLALFYIVRTLFDEDAAILFICLFPYNYYGVKITSLCFISVAALLYIIKRTTFRAYFLFWFVVLISAFTSYDEGISLGIACILAYVLLIFKEKDKLKRFILSGTAVGGAALLSYIFYALFTGIPVISRLREWLSVSVGSSSTWALADFGDPSTFAFLFAYFIVPVSAVVILVVAAFWLVRNKNHMAAAVLTIVFALAQLLFFTRTVVYHNLAACLGQNGVLLNYVHWTIPLFVLYLWRRKGRSLEKQLLAWLCTFGILLFAEGALVTSIFPNSASSVFAYAAAASENWDLHNNTTENLGKERLVFDQPALTFIEQFETIFDTLLTREQTFIDFANITSLYALTGRERPCYVAQTPGLLTDLYSQECYLDEVAQYDCPLAIVGTTEDTFTQQMIGIPHNIRYYKIAEYIYRNYQPLVKTGDFVIWCKKGLRTGFTDTLAGAGLLESGYTLVDYGYDAADISADGDGSELFLYEPYHQFSLQKLPYIWAHYDEYEAWKNDVLEKPENVEGHSYVFSGSQKIKTPNGNYMAFECVNPSETDIEATVIFLDSREAGIRYEYSFTALPGSNTYMIRVSQDYFWEAFNIDTINFESEQEFQIKDINILTGD